MKWVASPRMGQRPRKWRLAPPSFFSLPPKGVGSAKGKGRAMQQWEYLDATWANGWSINGQELMGPFEHEDDTGHQLLNQSGADGWKLVSAVSNEGEVIRMIFKRPKG